MSIPEMMDTLPPKFYNDDKTKLICQYCLSEMKMITPSHLKSHDMTLDEYRDRFPDAPLSMKKQKKKIITSKKEEQGKEIRYNIDISDKTKLRLKKMDTPIDVIVKVEENKPDIPIEKQLDLGDDQKILTKDRVFKAVQKVYPNIKRNHIFKKTNIGGNILYTVMTDFGDPSKRVMIDFSGMAWHVKTPLLTKYRKKDLLSESKWKYIHIEEDSLTTNEIIEILKSK